MEQNNKCIGVTGWLFGHNFEAFYETNTENYTADEKVKILKQEQEDIERIIVVNRSDYISPATQFKKQIKIFKGCLCTRCGQIKLALPLKTGK